MQPDPTGSVSGVTAPDTTAEPSTAPETGPTAGGSPAVESQSDEATEPSQQPTPGDEPAEDDGEDEGIDSEQTDEQKRLSRRERQKLREQERIDKAVQSAIAVRDREATEAAERQKRETEAAAARAASAKEFAEYVGADGESDRLSTEIGELHKRLRAEIGTLTQDEFDELEADIRTRETRIADITRARGFQDKIAANIWNGIEAHMLHPLGWSEFSDQATRAKFLGAEGGIAGAWDVARDVLVAAVEGRKDVEIKALKESHASEVATLRDEVRGWRVRAGAEEAPDTTSGGSAATSGSALTPQRYAAMTFEQRQKLRSTPEGRAAIDAMSRSRTGFGQASA